MATDTNVLMDQAKCLNSCIPDGMKPAIIIYLLARLANVNTADTKTLMANARCIDCEIPDGMKASVIVYLFDRWLNP